MKKILQIWKDPVISKVISAGIIGLILFTYTELVENELLKDSIIKFLNSKFKLWQFAIVFLILIFVIFVYKKYTKSGSNTNVFDDIDINTINLSTDYDEESIVADINIFNHIRNIVLPSNNGIYWLRQQNFRGSFNIKSMNDFFNFQEICTDPNYTFINNSLEEHKQSLLQKITLFNDLIGINTWSTKNGLQTIPPEWETEQPERFSKTIKEIHSVVFEIIELYDNFIKMGKKTLKI